MQTKRICKLCSRMIPSNEQCVKMEATKTKWTRKYCIFVEAISIFSTTHTLTFEQFILRRSVSFSVCVCVYASLVNVVLFGVRLSS